ncbi:MAG: hypothetical protein EPN97_07180 [Alphaproteobacteria bacterium]|nr:MAG: hypothetical protein EPN97_07180 [Alphaproteobacteria bacterium]
MNFTESGLPKHQLVEDAFDYSRLNAQNNQKEALKSFQQQIEMIHNQNLLMLDMEKDAGDMKDDEYKRNKQALERMRDDQLKMGPALITRELENMFEKRRVGPAKIAAANADNATPELVAAIMLIDCVRSPVDYKNVSAKFGEGVAGLIAEVVHIDAYPSERDVNLSKASGDAKRAYQSLLITSLDQIVDQIARAAKENPGQKIMFPPGQEEQIYNDIKNLWGNDKKLDAKFLAAFNKASDSAGSPYKLEVDNAGALELVKGSVKAGPGVKPPKPKGPDGGIGGDVF